MLSGGNTRELLRAIAAGDSARFQAVPGIGKRTAERIIVELRDKVAGQAAEGRDHPQRGTRARWRARASSASASAPQEADELLAEASRRDARGPDRRGAEGVAVMDQAASGRRRRAHPGGPRLRRRRRARPLAPAAQAGGLRRPAGGEGPARRCSSRRRRAAARHSTTCCSPARPALARPRSRRSSPRELGVPFVADRRPGARAQGRPRRVPHALEPGAVLLHRRDPPPQPRRSRRPSTRRWRTAARPITVGQGAGARASSRSTCPPSR